ncbi:MAG: glycosyltransferase family 4 protein [Anaerolineae bacterium]|nr:glycosyltransferase family 4 protein [Anaerolineae bacterium]
MHIVILSDTLPPDSLGGAGRIAWNLGQGLIAAGHQVTFVTSTPGHSRVETRQGITVHALHSNYPPRWVAWLGLFNPQTVWPLNRLLRKLEPDVIHAHNVHQHLGYHSLVIARFTGAATVFTAHDVMPFAYAKLTAFIDPLNPDQCDGWDYRLPFGYNIRQMRLRWNPARNLSIRHTMHYYIDERIAVSHALKCALEANRLPPFDVVHNGLDLSQFDVPQVNIDVLRQRFKLEGRRVILFGGRLSRHKGDQQLFAALRRIKERVPDVALLVLARPSKYTEQMVYNNPDLAGHIVLGGWLEDAELAAAYRLADTVAVPSVCFDSFPTVSLEGMAAGAPPVLTCFGGGREAVIDGETGFVVNPYNIDALADRLTRLLTDEALRRRMAGAGRTHMEQHFTLDHHIQATLDVYDRALTKRREAAG